MIHAAAIVALFAVPVAAVTFAVLYLSRRSASEIEHRWMEGEDDR